MTSKKPAGRQHGAAISRLRQEVRAALVAAGVARGDGVVVACSHGPDSLALADAILALGRPLGLGPVTLAYVHHGLRGAADAEAAAVAALAAEAGCGFAGPRVSVPRKPPGGPEDAARAARYAALEKVADESGAAWIATGHTASDQAESVVMRLLRGAGPRGLAGIPARRGRLVRPLLGVSRGAVEAYLAARELRASRDESNASPRFLRNRVRHAVLPALRAENPSIDDGLATIARVLREVAEDLETLGRRALAEATRTATPEGLELSVPALTAWPPTIVKAALAQAAEAVGGRLDEVHQEAAARLIHAASGRARVVAPGVGITRIRKIAIVEPRTSSRPARRP